MANNLRIRTIVEFDAGSETVRIDQEVFTTVDARDKFDVIKTLADDHADGNVELFNLTSNPVFAGGGVNPNTRLLIFVDPDDDKAAVLPIVVKIVTTAGDVIAFQLDRRAPLIFTDTRVGAAGGDMTTITGRIATVTARNNNAAPVSGNNDVTVRVLAWKS